MIGRTDHRGKAGRLRPGGTGRILAMIEECMADALPAVFGQQHAFAEIEQILRGNTALFERSAKGGFLVPHRRGGGSPDDARAIACRHQHGAGRGGIFGKIARLVSAVAVIEIGPGGKHRDAQGRQVIQRGGHFRAAQRADADAHSPTTCAVQSARL